MTALAADTATITNPDAPLALPTAALAEDNPGREFWTSATEGTETPADTNTEPEPAPQPTPESAHQPNQGKITCRECSKEFGSLAGHLKSHGMTVTQYHAKHPGAPIVAEGVQVGRRRKDSPPPAGKPSRDPLSILLADASKIDLAELGRRAVDNFARLDAVIEAALNGKSAESRAALAVGYAFAGRCLDEPEVAAALPGWADVEVKEGANPWYRPLKWCCRDAGSINTTRITMVAAVYRDAYSSSPRVEPKDFPDALRRQGYLRKWYNDLPKAPKPTDTPAPAPEEPSTPDTPVGETIPSAGEGAATLSAAEAAALLQSHSFGQAREHLDTASARKLLQQEGFQAVPDHLTQEQGRALFPAPLTLVVWRADLLPSVKDMLEAMAGFVRILDLSSTDVADVVTRASNDR